jgi:hypothetical protein
VPQRFELGGDEEEGLPERRRPEAEARQLLILRVTVGVVGLAVLVWLVVLIVGFVGRSREASRIYDQVHFSGPSAPEQADIQAFAASLTVGQWRVLVAGRPLPYSRLTAAQQGLFTAIRPLSEPDSPTVIPYAIRLDRESTGELQLRLVWQVPDTGEAVVEGLRIE